jgi:hypothetical protein
MAVAYGGQLSMARFHLPLWALIHLGNEALLSRDSKECQEPEKAEETSSQTSRFGRKLAICWLSLRSGVI